MEACKDFLENAGVVLGAADAAEIADEKKMDERTQDFLILELVPLPLLTEEGDQTPIGGRGWYSSAVLSAMLLSGHQQLTKDIMFGMHSKHFNRVMIELGSGTLGLAGTALAWVVAQQQMQASCQSTTKTKVVLTDYDDDVLGQLKINAHDANQRLKQHFRDAITATSIPEIGVAHMDWNEYDQDQPLLQDTVDYGSDHDDNDSKAHEKPYAITFVCGAALVYCEETAACADQVAKILREHPHAAVWVVQWPRKGWFSVFQQQLQHKFGFKMEKFTPAKDIHANIHHLAQQFMPPQLELDTAHIKAVRITSRNKAEE
jgi:hypothetical protein